MAAEALYTKIEKTIQISDGSIVLESPIGFPRNESNLYLVEQNGNIIWKAEKPDMNSFFFFLLFSLLFLSNTYKLWFKTDSYYKDVYDSLVRSPVPFKDFFLRRLENRKRWEVEQKIYSVIGFIAVIGADVLVVMAFLK